MRLPNGYGTVYKLSGNRRKPFMVRKTIGWSDEGKQLYKTIGYYETRKLALAALADYNANPYDIDASSITFSELFTKWSEEKYIDISKSAINGYNAAYDTSKELHDLRFIDIKANHLQNVINTCGKGYGTQRKIKSLYNQLYKYAMKNDVVQKDYSNYVELGKKIDSIKRVPFSEKEIKRLFKVVDQIP